MYKRTNRHTMLAILIAISTAGCSDSKGPIQNPIYIPPDPPAMDVPIRLSADNAEAATFIAMAFPEHTLKLAGLADLRLHRP